MVTVQRPITMTVEAFDQWILLPENVDHDWEYVAGEINKVVSNSYPSEIAARFLILLGGFIVSNNLGIVTGPDGGYKVQGERYIPDVGYVSYTRMAKNPRMTYIPIAPDLAVEVISPTDEATAIRFKIANYLAAGTTVWVVEPEKQHVELYAPGQPVKAVGINDTLDGGAVLPGFSLAVRQIFPDEPE